MWMTKVYGLAIPDEWMFRHRNDETMSAIGKAIGYDSQNRNQCVVLLYKEPDDRMDAYKELDKLGSGCFMIQNPLFVNKRYIK